MLIFEMVAGYPPFYSENKVEMFKVRMACDQCTGTSRWRN